MFSGYGSIFQKEILHFISSSHSLISSLLLWSSVTHPLFLDPRHIFTWNPTLYHAKESTISILFYFNHPLSQPYSRFCHDSEWFKRFTFKLHHKPPWLFSHSNYSVFQAYSILMSCTVSFATIINCHDFTVFLQSHTQLYTGSPWQYPQIQCHWFIGYRRPVKFQSKHTNYLLFQLVHYWERNYQSVNYCHGIKVESWSPHPARPSNLTNDSFSDYSQRFSSAIQNYAVYLPLYPITTCHHQRRFFSLWKNLWLS